jgi:PGF-pre-PGF domain-containing protein
MHPFAKNVRMSSIQVIVKISFCIALLVLAVSFSGAGVALASGETLSADFSSDVRSGYAPLNVTFTGVSENATEWQWDVDEGTSIYTSQSFTHAYHSAGVYNVTLTVSNLNETTTVTKESYIEVIAVPVLPVAGFSGTPTSGTVPLTVVFTDLSSSATSWEWNFGDSSANSTIQNPTHTYTTVGTYTVTLTAENGNGTSTEVKTNYIVVDAVPVLPVAGFSGTPTSGTVPLTVVFTDLSSSATSWEWNFGDSSANSTIQNPTHTYTTVGTYTVTLTVENGNGTLSTNRAGYITVTAVTPTTGGGGGGSGGQSTGEKYENIDLKDYSIKYVLRDTETMFEFTKEGNSIVGLGFTARLNGGQTKTVIEMLKSTSTMVNKAAPGTVYKNVNIWVGDGKTTPDLLSDARIMFKVEKTWIAGNGIDPASIRMLRYNSGSWAQLPTSRTGEDETYVYYITQTPGFSAFAISSVGKEQQQVIPGSNQQGSQSQNGESAQMSTEDSQTPQAGHAVSPEAKSSGSFTFLLVLAGISALGVLGYRYKDQLSQVRTQLGNPDGKRYRRLKRS